MAKAKSIPIPLQTLIARKNSVIASNEWLARGVEPLPHKLEMEFFLPGTPKSKGSAWTMWSKKLGRSVSVQDKATAAKERAHRKLILEEVSLRYPQYIPYLPMCLGWAFVQCSHLMPPPEDEKDYWIGKEHVSQPDTENLGKLARDAATSRTKKDHPVLYWDDCPITHLNDLKVYWDYTKTVNPHYPPQPGSILHVVLCPLTPRPDSSHCKYCFKPYYEGSEQHLIKHEDKCKRNPFS